MSHSRQTEHYELPLYNGTDIINPLTDFNDTNEAIDEAVYNANQRSVEAQEIAQHIAESVGEYDERITEAETTATNAGVKVIDTQKMIADEFNPLKQGGYEIGDIVFYDDGLYSFVNPHSGAWNVSDVTKTNVIEIINRLVANINALSTELDATKIIVQESEG